MPLYEVFHTIPLSPSQQSAIASGITTLHCDLFRRPRFFATVIFHYETASVAFVGGQPSTSNRIISRIRTGNRQQSDYDHIATGIAKLWDTHVADPHDAQTALRGVYITGTILTAVEGGYLLPQPGEQEAWVKANIDEIRRRASSGDQENERLLQDLKDVKWLK